MNGLPGNPVTSGGGFYNSSVASGWGGTVIPTKVGYTFSASSRSYVNVVSDQLGQNYTPTQVTSGWIDNFDGNAPNMAIWKFVNPLATLLLQ